MSELADEADLKSADEIIVRVQIPLSASEVVKGSPQNLDKGETIYPHPPLMTDAPGLLI